MVDTKGRQNVTSSTQYLHIGSWSDLVFVALQDTEVASNTKEQRALFSNVSHLMYAKLRVFPGLHSGAHIVGEKSPLFSGIRGNLGVLQSHKDQITPTPDMEVLGTTGGVLAAFRINHLWGVQFHPERSGPAGARLLANFLRLR
jgi:anthranilate/para-aminobenzoate synthase component II